MADKLVKTKQKTARKEALAIKSLVDLKKDLQESHNNLLESRRGHRAGELTNPRVITTTRKEIARLKTAIRLEELKGDK